MIVWILISVLYIAIVLLVMAVAHVWEEDLFLKHELKMQANRMDLFEQVQNDTLQKYIRIKEFIEENSDGKIL